MDIIKRATLFGAKAIVTVLKTTDNTNKAIALHSLSDRSAEALSKVLTIGAFISSGFKIKGNKLSITVNSGNDAGKIIVSADYGTKVRGFIENKNLPNDISVKDAIGQGGNISIIKDFGMKNPYVGNCEIINGNLDEDFALYFTLSEQLPSAIALCANVVDGKCLSSGGIVIQPMPNCDDHLITILEDIARNFKDFHTMLEKYEPEEIITEHFGHFEHNILPSDYPEFKCKCNSEKIESMIKTLGQKEAQEIVAEQGKIEVFCDFCSSFYRFSKTDVDRIFGGACE